MKEKIELSKVEIPENEQPNEKLEAEEDLRVVKNRHKRAYNKMIKIEKDLSPDDNQYIYAQSRLKKEAITKEELASKDRAQKTITSLEKIVNLNLIKEYEKYHDKECELAEELFQKEKLDLEIRKKDYLNNTLCPLIESYQTAANEAWKEMAVLEKPFSKNDSENTVPKIPSREEFFAIREKEEQIVTLESSLEDLNRYKKQLEDSLIKDFKKRVNINLDDFKALVEKKYKNLQTYKILGHF
jgi:hypothetical protein